MDGTIRIGLILLMLIMFFLSGCNDSLSKKYSQLQINMALLVPTNRIDEVPVWAENEKSLFLKISGSWFKLHLSKIKLKKAIWLNNDIGININNESITSISERDMTLNEYIVENTFNPRMDSFEEQGMHIKLQQQGLRTKLILVKEGKETILLSSNMDNWHSPKFSPSGKWVVFVSENNGLLLLKVVDL